MYDHANAKPNKNKDNSTTWNNTYRIKWIFMLIKNSHH